MTMLISCGKFDKKYLCYILSLIIYYAISLSFNLIIITSNKEQQLNVSLKKNLLVSLFLEYFGLSLCFIPELIRKNNSSFKARNDINYGKMTIKDIFNFGIISLTSLISNFAYIFHQKFKQTNPILLNINNYIVFFIILYILSLFYFKWNYYNHQYIPFFILIIILISRYIYEIYLFSNFNIKIQDILIELSLNSITFLFKAFYIGFTKKILMENYYFSPYKVCYVFGIINGLIISFLLLILSLAPCNKGFFCSVEYNEQYYFDNIFNFFNENTFAQISLYLFVYITKTVVYILINMVIQNYSICHIFLLYEIIEFIPKIVAFISAILEPKIMVFFISYFLEVILVLIFLEKIELNFCGLNKNLKKNIQKRADIEMQDSLIEDEKIINSFEVNNNYIVNFKNDLEKKDVDEKENISKNADEAPQGIN